ncbi:pyrroloquinoline quinone-dependent dehydrogenase [Candidatus Litorirhabdus singularis]|uniref:pyrroloquinoline quinone-dependent dehydrogenase n=1 Tax=Candidatus Litorirhabdus singularis TaxID=2518993 RepID=UPI00242BC750|nr:pyrroloquinoline quinone-dependent dehydrogenase [Candidatus Litorirhabdus singularis]
MNRYYLSTLALAFLLSVACTPAPERLGEIPLGVPSEWPAYGATAGGSHFSRANQITPENVAHLELAWEHRSGDIREAGKIPGSAQGFLPQGYISQSSLQVTPIVVEDRLYYCTPFNRVFALDANSGEELWVFDPEIDHYADLLSNCRGVSSWQSGKQGFCEHRILLGTLDARLIALDAATGRRCEDFGDTGEVDTSHGMVEHHPAEYSITSPPAILGENVITGALVLDNQRTDSPSGVIRAYNVRTGELVWAWHPVAPGDRTLEAGGEFRAGTTNVWSIISVDEERDLVFLPTGNTTPDYYGGHRQGSDYYSSSVVALRGSTGELVWHFQTVHHDIWDYDVPAQPTLVDLQVDGETVPAVVQVTKMGMTFALHRETGEPLWPVEERPVPQTGAVVGEYLSPTQPFPTHIPHLVDPIVTADDVWGMVLVDQWACAKKIAEYNNLGWYTPPSVEGTLNSPANAGGNNWGSPAIHPDSGVMVVYTNRVPGITRLIPRQQCEGVSQQMKGTPHCVQVGMFMSPLGIPCTKPPWGTLDAIDLNAGKVLWSVPLGTTRNLAPFPVWWIKGLPGLGGVMMTDSGLVFAGISNSHTLRAFDVKTGAQLWEGKLPTGANAVPMTYQVGDRQYVLIAAGGHWGGGSPPGDHIMAFALPVK